MIIVSVLPILVLTLFLNRVSEDSIRKSVSTGFQSISQRAAKEVYVFISATENILKSTSEAITTIYPDEWKSKLILRNLTQDLEGFKSVSLIGTDGQEIVSSNVEIDKTNYSKEDFFKEAISGITFYSEVYISKTLMPTMKIGVPAKKLNKVIGVLVAEITVRYLWELVDDIKIGETGHAYIVSKNGTVIAHPQRERVVKQENFQYIPIVKRLLRGANATAEYVNGNKISVLGSGAIVPNLGWGIIVEQSIEEAFALVTKIRYLTISLVVLAIFFAITVGFLRAAKITSPIRQLTEGVRRVAKGDLSYSIPVKSDDEIGELAENFNKMTVSLKETQEQLIQNERLAILGRLSSKIAHEVRNPLQAIKGASEHLNDKFNKNELIQKLTKIITQEVNQLSNFIDVVLSSSKKVKLQLMFTNINAILENMYQLILKDSRFEKIKITKDFDVGIPNCFLDSEHLQRAFLNVVINAMQAISNKGEIKIGTKHITKPENYIEITVQDNGKGVPDEIRKDIFKPFVTTKSTGTGLGLSYFYETIKQHQGEVKVESTIDKGTTFLVHLPIRKSDKL